MSTVRLPHRGMRPAMAIVRRVVIALLLVVVVAMIVWLDRDGYRDAIGGSVSLLDAFYYATVTVTTTGYGDITPVTDMARLMTTLLVTPARVVFLIVLVGTTLELLTERWRETVRLQRWRRTLHDHYVVCGYGTMGRSAIETLLGQGIDRTQIVVVDTRSDALAEANRAGYVTVAGDASRTIVLTQAEIARAAGVIVATNRDDTAVLITLTARELNRGATIVSAVREQENAHLLREGGADSVITSSQASGRLLGTAMRMPRVAGILEDLLTAGEGLDIVERGPEDDEVGGPPRVAAGEMLLAIVRGEETLRFDRPEAARVEPGDRILLVCARQTRAQPRT